MDDGNKFLFLFGAVLISLFVNEPPERRYFLLQQMKANIDKTRRINLVSHVCRKVVKLGERKR
ncbi:CLUMA_CG014830, isoform A [Clunio marinus]|uniref:CLUMA_CG014830, isoform A n=1 Tax=Clunio marinus TaxID=568069 RepID=A0A1J1ILN8_9DIPT|nr:CLUMA_CG014830, isoform A [Clunio marinus]